MTEETATYMTAPDAANDHKLLPRRNGPRSMLPSTWLNRQLTIEYTGADGRAASTCGRYLDHCPVGLILLAAGGRCVISWDRIVVVELQEQG